MTQRSVDPFSFKKSAPLVFGLCLQERSFRCALQCSNDNQPAGESMIFGSPNMRGEACAKFSCFRIRPLPGRRDVSLISPQNCLKTWLRSTSSPERKHAISNGWLTLRRDQRASLKAFSAIDDSLSHPIPEPEQSGGTHLINSQTCNVKRPSLLLRLGGVSADANLNKSVIHRNATLGDSSCNFLILFVSAF